MDIGHFAIYKHSFEIGFRGVSEKIVETTNVILKTHGVLPMPIIRSIRAWTLGGPQYETASATRVDPNILVFWLRS